MDRIIQVRIATTTQTTPRMIRTQVPTISEHWSNQSKNAPYPINRPSCFYEPRRRYSGEEMSRIVELSRGHMAGHHANKGDFDPNEAISSFVPLNTFPYF